MKHEAKVSQQGRVPQGNALFPRSRATTAISASPVGHDHQHVPGLNNPTHSLITHGDEGSLTFQRLHVAG